MSRETKIGMIVAFSFLLLVGGVLAYKLWLAENPADVLAEGNEEAATATEPEPGATGTQEPSPSSGPSSGPALAPPPTPPPMPPSTFGRPPAPMPPMPPGDLRPAVVVEPATSAAAVEVAANDGQVTREQLEGVLEFAAEQIYHMVVAGVDLSGSLLGMMPNQDASASSTAVAAATANEPITTPSPAERPTSPPMPPMVPAEPASAPAVSEPTVAPPPRPRPPSGEPLRTQPASGEPVPRQPGPVPPVPSPTAFDKQYETPANLGKPVEPSATRPVISPRTEARPPENAGGIPVTIRPQPEVDAVPRPAGGTPVVIPRDAWTGSQPIRPVTTSPQPVPAAPAAAKVESFDVEVYVARAGDTYASISNAKYSSDKYQQALALFNRERDPRLETPQPGRPIYLPPKDYLERRFNAAIPGLAPPPTSRPATAIPVRSESPVNPATSRGEAKPPPAGELNPRVAAEAKPLPAPASPGPAPAATAKEIAKADWTVPRNEKQYRVRPNDTIWGIAKRTLGKGERWTEIAKLNKDRLRDVNQLPAGTVLLLPADANVDAAETPQ